MPAQLVGVGAVPRAGDDREAVGELLLEPRPVGAAEPEPLRELREPRLRFVRADDALEAREFGGPQFVVEKARMLLREPAGDRRRLARPPVRDQFLRRLPGRDRRLEAATLSLARDEAGRRELLGRAPALVGDGGRRVRVVVVDDERFEVGRPQGERRGDAGGAEEEGDRRKSRADGDGADSLARRGRRAEDTGGRAPAPGNAARRGGRVRPTDRRS